MLHFIIILTVFILWAYILSVLHRAKIESLKFLVGTLGMFLFGLFLFSNTLITPFSYFVTSVSGFIGNITNTFDVFSNYGILSINGTDSVNLYIDFECSGILEILTFVSMIMFFPVYKIYEKILIQFVGVVYILVANVIRLSFIGISIYYLGMDYYFIIHSVIARLLFLIMIVGLFFYTLTKNQILKQKVGKFNYV